MFSRREFLASTAAAGGLSAVTAFGGTSEAAMISAVAATSPGKHRLPPLPYSYDALEPHISAEILKIHHDKHHAGYVNGLNKMELALAESRKKNDFDLIAHHERYLAFHACGHINHTIYWENMKPGGAKEPTGALAKQIENDFGSVKAFKAQFTAAAAKVEGSGWGAMVWTPMFKRLSTVSILNHQNAMINGAVTLLIADVWEHAYYLKYQNRRGDYLDAWWNVVNWDDVAARFADAVKT